MANQSAKKRVEQNAERLRKLQILILATNVLHVLVRFWLKSSSLWWFNYLALAMTSLVYFICYGGLHLAAEPSFNNAGELTDGGADLALGGVCEYYHDGVYISVILQALSLLSDRMWLVFLVVPGYLVYLLWTNIIGPWIFTPTQEEMDENERHRQQKNGKEKKGVRRRR